jgi:parallel beta-helix repeat protein
MSGLYHLTRKWLAVGIILLFVGTCIIPAMAQDTEKPLPTTRVNTLYVGGSGPGNYTRIQDAVNASTDGDTVYVYDDSSPYQETLSVTHSITLLGENQTTTVIDAIYGYFGVYILADHATMQGFTVLNASWYGIRINASYVTVSQTTVRDCQNEDIYIGETTGPHFIGNLIENDTLSNSLVGILLWRCLNTTIAHNTIFNNSYNGIRIEDSFNNTIIGNRITSSGNAIEEDYGSSNLYTTNLLQNNFCGIYFWAATFDKVIKNTFLDNNRAAYFGTSPLYLLTIILEEFKDHDAFFTSHFHIFGPNVWSQNYWNKPRNLPYPIYGEHVIYLGYWELPYPIIAFDWHPAQEPYDIPGMR